MKSGVTILKSLSCTIIFVLITTSLGIAQQNYSTNINQQTIFDRLQSNLRVELSGSIITATHGMQFTFPAFWVGQKVKVEPLVGFFWEDFAGSIPASGIRMIYYFKRQPFDGSAENANTFYAGLSGMSTEFTTFGREVAGITFTGLLFGHSFNLTSNIELNPEVLLAIDESTSFQPEA